MRSIPLPAVVLAAALAVASPAAAQTMRMHVIDVGQGAATLLEFPCAAILVDAGGEDNALFHSTPALIAYLDAFFQTRPDLDRTLASLVISHPHIDHTLGVPEALSHYRVLNAVTNGYEKGKGAPGQKALHERVAAGEETATTDDDMGLTIAWHEEIPLEEGLVTRSIDPVDCPEIDPDIRVLWGELRDNPGWTAEEFRDQNNHSVVLRVGFGDASILLPGDMEKVALHELIDSYSDSGLLDVDVLLAAHHGSHNGTTAELLEAVTPEIAVIAMGKEERRLDWTAWKYGHPRKAAVDLLLQYVSGVRSSEPVRIASAVETFLDLTLERAIYATGWDGTVVLEADAGGAWRVVSPADGEVVPLLDEDGPPISDEQLDINAATVAELMELPLIGESRAEAIVAYRASHGPFASVESLDDVPGIGSTTINAIRNLITAG